MASLGTILLIVFWCYAAWALVRYSIPEWRRRRELPREIKTRSLA
jgi:hypothetical protein